jgi:NADPH:quinone reductase-like Zn-dependent oxidoreductase
MRAAARDRYGSPDVLSIREFPKPKPGERDVLIRVAATTVSRTDCGVLRGKPALFVRPMYGVVRPRVKILGMDFAGIVEQTGSRVERYRTGDRVFGFSPDNFGAHAEYLCLPESAPLALVPDDFELSEAVVSTRHLDLLESLGADRVIDYTAEDFAAIGETFDYVLDAVGKTTYFRCRKLLGRNGRFSASDLGPFWQNIALSAWSRAARNRRFVFPMPRVDRQFTSFLGERLAAREFRAVIDRVYALDDIAQAFRYVETATKTGIVVVNVSD